MSDTIAAALECGERKAYLRGVLVGRKWQQDYFRVLRDLPHVMRDGVGWGIGHGLACFLLWASAGRRK
jgi:hypothetical protein